MDLSCAAPGTDDKSSEEFNFEVPITNLKLESRNKVDVLYVINAVSADIEALDCEITNTIANKDVTKTPVKKIEVLKEAKSADDVDSVNAIVIDNDNDAKNRNEEPKEREYSKILDDTEETEITITDVPKKVQNDEKQTEAAIVLDDIASNSVNSVKSIKETDKNETIDLGSDNVVVLKDNKSDSDVIVLDVNKTNPDVIVLDGNKTDSKTTIICDDELIMKYPTHPIVIDEDKDNDCSIVEASSTKSNRLNRTEYDKLFRENSLLSELIEKCFDMENTEGMGRVINRTLLAIYKDLDETYKKSDGFSKALKKTITCLDVYPNRKFCHLKNLCDELKSHKAKKRVPFITLKRADKDKESTSCIPTKKKRLEVVIDLDDENNDVNEENVHTQAKNAIDLVQIDDSSSDDNDVIIMDKNYNSNKENDRKTNKITKTPKKRGRPRKDRSNGIQSHSIHKSASNRNHSITEQDILAAYISHNSNATTQFDTTHTNQYITNPSTIDSESLLEPRQTTYLDMDEINQQKIRNIETYIAFLQSRIEVLEESEVIADNHMSPYIISEDLKGTIVKLYKELCQITGIEATKRHEVRLQAVAGHPEGPVRCLEEFLNANIDEAGNPPFPDMQDVIQCVCMANLRYNLQWTHKQIMNEAVVLFIQYGHSMQKRRQQREFKSLIRLVKEEMPDPADDDPVLQARLMENSRIAKRNEQELLERFVNLEHGFDRRSNPKLRLSIDQSEDSDDDDSDVDSHPDNVGPAKATGTGTAEEISEPSIQPNTIRTDNILPTFNVIETIGSSVTVSNGSLVIEPTVKYGLPQPQEGKNVKSSEFSLFLSEFQRYIYNSRDKYSVHNKLVKEKAVSKHTSVHNFENTKESSDNIQSTKDDFENATNLAKEILSLVQPDLSTENKAKEDVNLNTNQYTTVERLNPIIKLTNLNQNTFRKTNECSSVKVNISNHELKQNNKSGTEDGFDIFTHTTICENVNEDCNREKTDRNKTNSTEKHSVSEETNQNENVDSNMDDVNDIVKPEPLDIPSMLDDLGQGFTSTIFDIEDPFLVIEISDSSESDDDDL